MTFSTTKQYVCTRTHTLDQVTLSGCPIFHHQTANAIISKTKDFFSFFYCILEICIQFRTFWKKGESPSSRILEIIDSERDGYINV